MTDQPATLSGLIRWYRERWYEEPPRKLHEYDKVDWDATGAPAWTFLFRHYLTDHPFVTDEDGYYHWPLHAAMYRMSRRCPMTYRWLFRLGMADGVLESTPGTPPGDMGPLFAYRALELLWSMYQELPRSQRVA